MTEQILKKETGRLKILSRRTNNTLRPILIFQPSSWSIPMGYPEHPHQRATNAGGVFIVLAVLAAAGLAAVLAVGLLGMRAYRTQSVATPVMVAPPTPLVPPPLMGSSSIDFATGDLTVEVDPQGQTYVAGEALSLEQIEEKFRVLLLNVAPSPQEIVIQVVEGTPFEHVEKVIAMYQRLGLNDPRLTTVPPYRHVQIVLDAEGRATVDGEETLDLQGTLEKIAKEHGSRATLGVRAHPQCPADAVVKLTQLGRDLGYGRVKLEKTQEQVADNPR